MDLFLKNWLQAAPDWKKWRTWEEAFALEWDINLGKIIMIYEMQNDELLRLNHVSKKYSSPLKIYTYLATLRKHNGNLATQPSEEAPFSKLFKFTGMHVFWVQPKNSNCELHANCLRPQAR